MLDRRLRFKLLNIMANNSHPLHSLLVKQWSRVTVTFTLYTVGKWSTGVYEHESILHTHKLFLNKYKKCIYCICKFYCKNVWRHRRPRLCTFSNHLAEDNRWMNWTVHQIQGSCALFQLLCSKEISRMDSIRADNASNN